MANIGCNCKCESNNQNYSSPVPVIGLYIAGGSLVCMMLLLCDVVAGFLHRKFWFPCKLFSINSVILSLLSIAAKLPVDLTSAMPGHQDQLSKLSGTTFICISMGLLMPSLGGSKEFESLANTVAMSIFVVTVVVNIIIQTLTGVISLFIVEHMIILCCMLLLLAMLWQSTLDINFVKGTGRVIDKDKLTYVEDRSILEQLIGCYRHAYNKNPQVILCMQTTSATISAICAICIVVLMQAVLRVLIILIRPVSSPKDSSDYGWSVWPIVVTQILFAIVGSVVTLFRRYSFSKEMFLDISVIKKEIIGGERSNPIFGFSMEDTCKWMFIVFIDRVVLVCRSVIKPLCLVLVAFDSIIEMFPWYGEPDNICALVLVNGELKRLRHYIPSEYWCEQRCMKNIKRWVDRSIRDPLFHLNQLLSRTPPSEQYHKMGFSGEHEIRVSSLKIVLLVRIAEVAMPSHLSGALVEAFREACDFIQFVENKINPSFTRVRRLANAMSIGTGFTSLLPRILQNTGNGGTTQSDLDHAFFIIQKLSNLDSLHSVKFELDFFTDYIERGSYSTVEELYDYTEQFFVDMLHVYMSQLPIAVFKEVTQNPDEGFEEKAENALKLVIKIGLIEDHIQWSFVPERHPFSHLTVPVLFLKEQVSLPSEGSSDDGRNVPTRSTLDDVIVQNV